MTPQLDSEARELLAVIGATGLEPPHKLTVAQARERMRAAFIRRGEPLSLLRVEDLWLPTPTGARRLRLYRPSEGILPVALFFHGGGWTVNDLDTHDDLCRRLTKRSGWLFVSLDYRRAPEHRHPAALEDAYHAYRWVLDNMEGIGGEPGCCALVGESSGGTMAAALALLLRDSGAPAPVYQIIAYPLMDKFDQWPSYRTYASGYILDREQLEWYYRHFMPDDVHSTDPYLLPLAARSLVGLPKTLVMTAEFDPLRDEGIAYARELAHAGVAVEHVHAEDQMHGFLMFGSAVAKAGRLVDYLADTLASDRRLRQEQTEGLGGQRQLMDRSQGA
jgi:acetyl esterase